MIQQNASCSPVVHKMCMDIARKCTAIIEPLLRQEEIMEAMREFYMAAREVIDKPAGREREV